MLTGESQGLKERERSHMGIRIEKTKEREERLTIDERIQDREERAAREVNWSSSQIYGKENREFGSFRLVQNGACHETSILGQFTPAVLFTE